jgi:hypothetical protein
MIYCKELDKNFESKDEMLIELKNNISEIIVAKKLTLKRADSYGIIAKTDASENTLTILKNITQKSFNDSKKSIDYTKEALLPKLKVVVISNTTNWFDSHRDVHIDGLWNKTLADNGQKGFDHLQEHENDFDKIISTKSKVILENTNFKALGFNYEGSTQALNCESIIDPNRNIFMYNQYANGWVENHSVGMRYVDVIYCADSNVLEMQEYKANYEKYYNLIANKSDVDECGYFYAVLQAKLCEFSAVPKGSNEITPTISVIADEPLGKSQADESLDKSEQSKDAQKADNSQKIKEMFNL